MLAISASPRTPRELSKSLLDQLSAYALAATSAGVGMLALVGSAQAKIVYSPRNVRVVNGTTLDLNHDHKADFRFATHGTSGESSGAFRLSVFPVGTKNRVWGTSAFASALVSGSAVGPNNKKFRQRHDKMGGWRRGWWGSSSSGPWKNVQLGYLGLKFFIQGKAHYGWARISANLHYLQFVLTGYAYETIPNKPIITGKTKGPDRIELEPASLGHLSRGASAISKWRTGNVAAEPR